jgi:hypothetical protein
MLIYSQLGKNGRLGNQMFQYAALYGTSFLRGYEYAIPEDGHDLFNLFDISADKISKDHEHKYAYKESGFSYENKISFIPDDTDIHGYYQSPYYWLFCEDNIRKEFTFKNEISTHANLLISSERRHEQPLCSIHVRRTDYIEKSDYHHLQSLSYYKNSIREVLKHIPNTRFLCFSDDIEWCKKNIGEDMVYVNNHPYIDFACMSQCDIHIMANSSFSWWAAFLSGSKAVVSPAQWFGPSGPSDWKSIYYPGWNQIEDK